MAVSFQLNYNLHKKSKTNGHFFAKSKLNSIESGTTRWPNDPYTMIGITLHCIQRVLYMVWTANLTSVQAIISAVWRRWSNSCQGPTPLILVVLVRKAKICSGLASGASPTLLSLHDIQLVLCPPHPIPSANINFLQVCHPGVTQSNRPWERHWLKSSY